MPSIGHPRRRVSKPHCRCAGRPNGWTWGSEERQAVAGGTRSCLDSCVKPSRRSPLGETRENHMVTQRFWSSAIYLATSNSHASGIVGPRHDHMAIIHRQAIDKQASKQARAAPLAKISSLPPNRSHGEETDQNPQHPSLLIEAVIPAAASGTLEESNV